MKGSYDKNSAKSGTKSITEAVVIKKSVIGTRNKELAREKMISNTERQYSLQRTLPIPLLDEFSERAKPSKESGECFTK